jgi:hypothetical protein
MTIHTSEFWLYIRAISYTTPRRVYNEVPPPLNARSRLNAAEISVTCENACGVFYHQLHELSTVVPGRTYSETLSSPRNLLTVQLDMVSVTEEVHEHGDTTISVLSHSPHPRKSDESSSRASTHALSRYGRLYTPARVNASTVHKVHREKAPSSPPTPSSLSSVLYRYTDEFAVRPPFSGVLRMFSRVEVNRGSAADMKKTRGMMTSISALCRGPPLLHLRTAESSVSRSS